MNYESLPFHRSWIALPDVQITRRVITLGQVASRKKLDPPTHGRREEGGELRETKKGKTKINNLCVTRFAFQSNTVAGRTRFQLKAAIPDSKKLNVLFFLLFL